MTELAMVTVNEKAGKEEFEGIFFEVFAFDGDVIGDNGDEYTWDKAIELGFESTADYLIEKHTRLHGHTTKAIINAVTELMETDGYYEDFDIQSVEINDKNKSSVIAFTYTTND